MVIDPDGQCIGRFESDRPDWRPGDVFELEGRSWRIVEILPEVSTMVTYNAVWVAAPV
jgi:Lhr-like helicase